MSNKRHNKNKKTKETTGLDSEFGQTIVCSAVIVVILTLFIVLIINRNNYGIKADNNVDIWAAEYARVSEKAVGIIFDGISTTEDKYNILRIKCNEYIEDSESSDDTLDINVEVNINEDTFVDEGLSTAEETKKLSIFDISKTLKNRKDTEENYDDSDMTETGPIYFEDMIMLRYVNSKGKLKVISGVFGENDNPTLLKQYELAGKVVESTSEHVDDNKITEAEYIDIISTRILNILRSSDNEEYYLVKQSTDYFTTDGIEAIINGKKSLNIDSKASIESVVGIAGKSDTSNVVKDRLYIQYIIDSQNSSQSDGQQYLNIVVKLNSNLRIFDIDIL